MFTVESKVLINCFILSFELSFESSCRVLTLELSKKLKKSVRIFKIYWIEVFTQHGNVCKVGKLVEFHIKHITYLKQRVPLETLN